MPENALVELDKKLRPHPQGASLAALEAWKRSLNLAGQEYAQQVQVGARGLLGATEQFEEGWELCRQEVLAGHGDEVQAWRDRFLRAFEERIAHLQGALELVRFASQVVAKELSEAETLKEEVASLTPRLQRLTLRWQTREDLEQLVAEDEVSDKIVKTPGVCGGDARVKGTRISVWGLEEWRRLGWSDAKILDAYPHLTQENLAAAWAYAKQRPEEIESAIRENQEA